MLALQRQIVSAALVAVMLFTSVAPSSSTRPCCCQQRSDSDAICCQQVSAPVAKPACPHCQRHIAIAENECQPNESQLGESKPRCQCGCGSLPAPVPFCRVVVSPQDHEFLNDSSPVVSAAAWQLKSLSSNRPQDLLAPTSSLQSLFCIWRI